jgi:hypothetical protein
VSNILTPKNSTHTHTHIDNPKTAIIPNIIDWSVKVSFGSDETDYSAILNKPN